MARLTPPPMTRGVFQLKAPFQVSVKTAYTVTAVRSFSEIISRNTDPMVLVYDPVGLSEEFYVKDQAAGAMVITLTSAQGHQIYVPDTYILSYPNMGDVAYAQTILAVSLGPMPVSFDTAAVEAEMKRVVAEVGGVSPTVRVARSPIHETVTNDEHVQLAAARRGQISARDDDSVRVRELEAQVIELQRRIQVYEQYINQ